MIECSHGTIRSSLGVPVVRNTWSFVANTKSAKISQVLAPHYKEITNERHKMCTRNVTKTHQIVIILILDRLAVSSIGENPVMVF